MRVLTHHVDLISTVAGPLVHLGTTSGRTTTGGVEWWMSSERRSEQAPRCSEGVRERTLKWGAMHRGVPGHARALGHHELTVGADDQGGGAELGRGQSGCNALRLLCRDKAASLLGALQGTGTRRRGAGRGQLLPFEFTRSGLQVEIVDLVD